jgi:hypothetical protein
MKRLLLVILLWAGVVTINYYDIRHIILNNESAFEKAVNELTQVAGISVVDAKVLMRSTLSKHIWTAVRDNPFEVMLLMPWQRMHRGILGV